MLENMDNHCAGCKSVCCLGIRNSHDLSIPYPDQAQIDINQAQFLETHPSFVVARRQEVDSEPATTIPVYDCTKFDKSSQSCIDHPNRPELCKNAGIDYKPSDNCLLWQKTHPRPNVFQQILVFLNL